MMKRCELCNSSAKIYCDSDRASLCWSCDAKVHSANFLVARHSRSLLCHVCQSPTPWSASGEKLGPSTASICKRCVVGGVSDDDDEDREESLGGNDDEIDSNDDDDEYEGDKYGVDELESADENDKQVVPWFSTPPPPAPSSSCSEELPAGDGGVPMKRKRQEVIDLSSEDDIDCSSLNRNLWYGKQAKKCNRFSYSSLVQRQSWGDTRQSVTGIRFPATTSLHRHVKQGEPFD